MLPDLGFGQSTTRRIAEKAGVSVGSLYQYFPNKEALVGALIDRYFNEHFQIIEKRALEIQDGKSAEQMIEDIIRAVMSPITLHRKTLRVVATQVFTLGRLDIVANSRKKIQKRVQSLIEMHHGMLAVKSSERASYVVVSAIAGLGESIIFDEDLNESDIELLVGESLIMVKRYLTFSKPD